MKDCENQKHYEIERQFESSEKEFNNIEILYEFFVTSEVILFDTYYDFDDTTLRDEDLWLRKRETNGKHVKIELKKKIQNTKHYEEIYDFEEINLLIESLGKKSQVKSFVGMNPIDKFSLEKFCELETTRKTFKLTTLNLVLDKVRTPKTMYYLIEIEGISNDLKDIPQIEEDIAILAKELNLKPGRSKVDLFLND